MRSEYLMKKMRNEVIEIFPFINDQDIALKQRDHQRDENLDEFPEMNDEAWCTKTRPK